MIAFPRKIFARAPKKPKLAADPRLAADPWLAELFALLGDRYQLGPDGAQVLRRTGRARFNPMPVWLATGERGVRGAYEVRGDVARGRVLLDERVSAQLSALGLSKGIETVEDWAGDVLTRPYAGRCEDARSAAAAVRFFCEESELQLNTAAEP
jgi:hypothetical protein